MDNKFTKSEKVIIIAICTSFLLICLGLLQLGYCIVYSKYEKAISQNIADGFTKQDVVFDLHSVDKNMVVSKDNTYYTVSYEVANKKQFQEVDKVSINCWYNENTKECRFESEVIQNLGRWCSWGR